MSLGPGISSTTVESRLGQPLSETVVDEEVLFQYGLWQLVFTEQGFEMAQKRFAFDQRRSSPATDARVRRLHPGVTMAAAETVLGQPESRSLQYEPGSEPTTFRILSYGPWELRFVDGRLDSRTKW